MKKLIGITGKARAGKDTFAAGLTKLGFSRAAFADALKEVTALIADESVDLYHRHETKDNYSPGLGMTRRQGLQLLGTEGIRKVLGPDVWASRTLRQWARYNYPDTVVSDVRFDNEADLIIANGGFIVRIVRPGNDGLTGEAGAHSSEHGVSEDRVLITIVNDGTKKDLWKKAEEFIVDLRFDPADPE